MCGFHKQGSESTVLKNTFPEASELSAISFPPVLPRVSPQPALGRNAHPLKPCRAHRAPYLQLLLPGEQSGAWMGCSTTRGLGIRVLATAEPCLPSLSMSGGEGAQHSVHPRHTKPRSLKAIAESCSVSWQVSPTGAAPSLSSLHTCGTRSRRHHRHPCDSPRSGAELPTPVGQL